MIDCNEGLPVEHACHLDRSLTYYLEAVVPLAVFGKTLLSLTLTGNTDDCLDQSIDSFKASWVHLLKLFAAEGSLEITVQKRGYAPLGGGQVQVLQRHARKLEAISLVEEGKVKRVRGLLTSARVSPQLTTRVVDKVREVLNDYIPDVWIHTDHYKKAQAGEQPGYALSLIAETTTGMILTKDFNFNAAAFKLPEDLGRATALALLDEIFSGGAVDAANQPTALLLMSLASDAHISQLKIGRVTQQSIAMLRHIKAFLNVEFKISEVEDEASSSDEEDEEAEDTPAEGDKKRFPQAFIFSCVGVGLSNLARKTE